MDDKQLRELADELFSKKMTLTSLHQEIAGHFYPMRADFTMTRTLGSEFASDLMTSFPITCHRELSDQFGSMLRPVAQPWFHTRQKYVEKQTDSEVRGYLEWFEETQRRAMYDRGALFTRATKDGDNDFAAFGMCAISVEMNKLANGLLYRCWHLRDMAWMENEEGKIGFVARRWKVTNRSLVKTFGDKVHPKVKEKVGEHPFDEVNCYHFIVDEDMYDGNAMGRPRWSVYYDADHQHLIEATPIWGKHYVIPRWRTYQQYSYSPAAIAALPDARLLQAMTFTLLEAGEKATNPPIIATQNIVRSDVSLYAGGITWVDDEYDERMGAAMRPLEQDFRGFNYGVALNQDTRALLHRAFYLDALTPLGARDKEETAYEVGQRVQKWIRDALPIFEPMEMEYNAALCDETFELMMRAGGFGDPRGWPKKLRGAEVDFAFASPLHDLIEQQKGNTFVQSIGLIGQAVGLDPGAATLPKVEVMLRDALQAVGAPATWVNSEAAVTQAKDQLAQQQQTAQKLAAMESASNTAKNLGQSGLIPAGSQGAPSPAAV